MTEPGWVTAGHGWQGKEASLRLVGWSRHRRVILLRRPIERTVAVIDGDDSGRQLDLYFGEITADPAGFTALPADGGDRGTDIQLMELVRAAGRPGPTHRGDHQLAVVALCGGAADPARQPDHNHHDQHPQQGRTRLPNEKGDKIDDFAPMVVRSGRRDIPHASDSGGFDPRRRPSRDSQGNNRGDPNMFSRVNRVIRSERLRILRLLAANVSNPLWVIFDRAHLVHSAYTLRLKDGLSIELRPHSGDWWALYEIMLRRDYSRSGQVFRQGSTVVDVGANIGCFSLLAAKAVGPSGRVIAIEPEENTFCQLVRNIELNGLRNITPLKVAIGGRKRTVTIHVDTNKLFTSLFKEVDGHLIEGAQQSIAMTTLEDLFRQQVIKYCDYLKLDCEGAEYEIIEAMSPELAQRVQQITMEVHDIPGADRDQLDTQLLALGYERIASDELFYYRRQSSRADVGLLDLEDSRQRT